MVNKVCEEQTRVEVTGLIGIARDTEVFKYSTMDSKALDLKNSRFLTFELRVDSRDKDIEIDIQH